MTDTPKKTEKRGMTMSELATYSLKERMYKDIKPSKSHRVKNGIKQVKISIKGTSPFSHKPTYQQRWVSVSSVYDFDDPTTPEGKNVTDHADGDS